MKTGDSVILTELPAGLLENLPNEDQAAIAEILGKPVRLLGYKDGRAELEFTDKHGIIHFLYVNPSYIQPL
jgi:hypothetical protein